MRREPLNQIVDTPVGDATATGHVASPVERLAPVPTHDEIARRPYQLFEACGKEPGLVWEDWFRAEREL